MGSSALSQFKHAPLDFRVWRVVDSSEAKSFEFQPGLAFTHIRIFGRTQERHGDYAKLCQAQVYFMLKSHAWDIKDVKGRKSPCKVQFQSVQPGALPLELHRLLGDKHASQRETLANDLVHEGWKRQDETLRPPFSLVLVVTQPGSLHNTVVEFCKAILKDGGVPLEPLPHTFVDLSASITPRWLREAIGPSDPVTLSELALACRTGGFVELDISRCGLNWRDDHSDLELLLDISPSLRFLNLSCNELGGPDYERWISEMRKRHKNIEIVGA